MMREGMGYAEYFANVQKLYEEAGYAQECRCIIKEAPPDMAAGNLLLFPDLDKKLHVGQAYAWNPTIQGTKCEETTYLTDEM